MLLGGAFTQPDRPLPDDYLSPAGVAQLSTLRTVANEVGATGNQVVIAWLLQREPTIVPIVAASSGDQLAETLGGAHLRLTDTQLTTLDRARSTTPVREGTRT